MINFFKYVFVETKTNWFIGKYHHFLSFSSDGTAIAGSTTDPKSHQEGEVQFWETATGAATSSFKHSSFVVFSPTDPNIAALVRSGSIHMMKRDSFGGKTWGGQFRHYGSSPGRGAVGTFNSDGKTIVVSSNLKVLCEYDVTTKSSGGDSLSFVYWITSVVCCPIKPGWFVVGDTMGELFVVSSTTNSKHDYRVLKQRCQLSPVDPVRVSACAWSQDGKWVATGNDAGDVFLWNAGVPTSLSFAMLLPHNRLDTTSQSTTSLVFVPDSTALIIISGGYLSVWDIERVEYVANSGLPDKATNIALDGPRNRLAVAVNDKISIYELKLPEQMCEMDGKSSIPSELAELDITDAVVISDPEPFEGLYFDIYRGAWKLDTPRIFEHVVAIKVLRPTFKLRPADDELGNARERQEFEDRLIKFLTTWAGLTHDNLVPLLGVSIAFGDYPAVITSWTTKGILSEYIKTEEYDEMKLITAVAKGVEYLHSKDIVHSDIRGSSVLVDELGNPRLADTGLLSILSRSPLLANPPLQFNVPYRWMAPELLERSLKKANFATDVYSLTMTSLEIFTAGDPFEGVSDVQVIMGVTKENKRPDKPDDVDDELWSLWSEGWNQDAAMRPNMENYVERLTRLMM